MLKFLETNSSNRSGTKDYKVVDSPSTVGDFIDAVLIERSNESGSIEIDCEDSSCHKVTLNYRKGSLLSNLDPSISKKKISFVMATGFLTRMDYFIIIKTS